MPIRFELDEKLITKIKKIKPDPESKFIHGWNGLYELVIEDTYNKIGSIEAIHESIKKYNNIPNHEKTNGIHLYSTEDFGRGNHRIRDENGDPIASRWKNDKRTITTIKDPLKTWIEDIDGTLYLLTDDLWECGMKVSYLITKNPEKFWKIRNKNWRKTIN